MRAAGASVTSVRRSFAACLTRSLQVIAELRRQFDEADADRSGVIDPDEACVLFAKHCGAGSTEAEIKRTASNLRNQVRKLWDLEVRGAFSVRYLIISLCDSVTVVLSLCAETQSH